MVFFFIVYDHTKKGNTPVIFRNFKKNFSIYVDVQMVNSVNND